MSRDVGAVQTGGRDVGAVQSAAAAPVSDPTVIIPIIQMQKKPINDSIIGR